MNSDDDKWESFETYKGPPEREWPVWLDRICKVFFSFVALGLVFSICGGLLWIAPSGEHGPLGFIGRWLAANEEPWMAWSRFIIGGVIGITFVIRCLRRPRNAVCSKPVTLHDEFSTSHSNRPDATTPTICGEMNRPDFHSCIEMLRSNDGQTYENGYQWLQGYLVDHIDDLLRLMKEEGDPIDRSKFVELVGDSKNPRVIPYLGEELGNPNREVRMWAYSSLEYFGHPDATAIAESFRTQNPDEDFL